MKSLAKLSASCPDGKERCGKTQTNPFFVHENWVSLMHFCCFHHTKTQHFAQIPREFAIERTDCMDMENTAFFTTERKPSSQKMIKTHGRFPGRSDVYVSVSDTGVYVYEARSKFVVKRKCVMKLVSPLWFYRAHLRARLNE